MRHFYAFMIIALFLDTGCTVQQNHLESTITVFPGSVYLNSGYSCDRKALVNRGTGLPFTQAEVIQWLLLQGLSEKEALDEYNDRFVSKCLEYILFECDGLAKDVTEYYERQFLQKGWRKKRGILNLEYTNGGGDWVGVYINEPYAVLVHVIGRWEEDDTDVLNSSISRRQVLFRFDGCSADLIFGKTAIDASKHATLYGETRNSSGSDLKIANSDYDETAAP